MLTKWHEDGRSIMWISVAKWKKVDHLEISWTSYSPPQASNFIKRVKKDLATPPRGHVTGPVALNFVCLFVPFQGLMQVLNVYCNCWTRTLISHVDSVQRDHSTIKRAVPPPPPPPPPQPGNMAQLAVASSVSTHCVSSTVTIPFQWQYTMGVVGSLEMF